MNVCCMYVNMQMCSWCQKRALNPLKLELQKVVNPMIGAGSFEKQVFLTTEVSLIRTFLLFLSDHF